MKKCLKEFDRREKIFDRREGRKEGIRILREGERERARPRK